MDPQQSTGTRIGRWKIKQKIGDGSFGNVYSATADPKTQASGKMQEDITQVAIKTEAITNIKQMLLLEYKIYQEFEGVQGFPRAIQYIQEQVFSFLVMEKLDLTLDKCAAIRFPEYFVPKDVLLLIMRDTLKIIAQLHDKGYLYRDVKPANFMLKNPYNQIHIIDFGLCKKYQVNGRHISLKENKKLVGTPVFCSLNTHAGYQQSRRDDLQSWVMMSLYLSINLPWESVLSRKQLTKQQQYEEIYKIKQKINWQEIFKQNQKGRNKTKIPSCLLKILNYVRTIMFEQAPNYTYIHQLIAQQYRKTTNLSIIDQPFSWESKIQSCEQQQYSPSPVKKIRKINFKVPGKQKQAKSLPVVSLPKDHFKNQKQNRSNID